VFFSEEKNQKTFTSALARPYPAMAGIYTLAEKQKSFGSFLQKRTVFADRGDCWGYGAAAGISIRT
jgi:hypothetical protein